MIPCRTPSAPGNGRPLMIGTASPARDSRSSAAAPRIVDDGQRHPSGQRSRLRRGVGGHRAVPVEVILRDVEHHPGGRPDRWRPVQLEAGQFDRDDVLLRFVLLVDPDPRRPASTASITGQPMLPLAVTCRSSARRIDSSIPVVVVLPLVPVTTSQSRGAPLAWSIRQASSTSPITSMPAAARRPAAGWSAECRRR